MSEGRDEPIPPSGPAPASVVLFDGYCSLCSSWVDFVLRWERPADGGAGGPEPIQFAALQSEAGSALATAHGIDPERVDSVVFVVGEDAFVRTDAVAKMLGCLRAPWSWLRVIRVVPRCLRDAGYRLVAKFRYRVFGRRDSCRVPSEAERGRFL